MITCTSCGTQSPDNTRVCPKCGILLSHQLRAATDGKRARTGLIIRSIGWGILLIVLAIVAPIGYHAGGMAYYRHHLKSITEGANRDCDGPVTSTTDPTTAAKINQCLAENTELTKAKKDLAAFAKPGEL